MVYTFSRDWYERIECPFCNKGIIQIHHVLPVKTDNLTSTVGGRTFRSSNHSSEKEEVQNDCPACGAKREKIQEKINKRDLSKSPSREDILKRMKDAGFPTKI